MLEIIKLTGDPNVIRGEYTVIVPSILENGRQCEEDEFFGCMAYPCYLQVSEETPFKNPQWLSGESFSHNDVADY